MDVFSQCRIVLVRTSHPGNIGAAARAMKTMGLSQLYLVQPRRFPDLTAFSRATHATDILDRAIVCDSLEQALDGTVAAYALSARRRGLSAQPQDIREAASQAVELGTHRGQVAWVFGNEKSGLTNEEMALCNHFAFIPTVEECCSLNLGSAVQVACYEYRQAALMQTGTCPPAAVQDETPLATHQECQGFYQHLEAVLWQTPFLENGNSERIMRRLQRLFDRSMMEEKEVMILRGILTAIQRSITQGPYIKDESGQVLPKNTDGQ